MRCWQSGYDIGQSPRPIALTRSIANSAPRSISTNSVSLFVVAECQILGLTLFTVEPSTKMEDGAVPFIEELAKVGLPNARFFPFISKTISCEK